MIPVIFIHRGNDTVHNAVVQAQQYNERVILLGDETNASSLCEFHPYRQYLSIDAARMSQVYWHMHSKPGVEWRLANYLRWFIIAQFMQENQLDRAFVADSDLLIYTDVTEIADDWGAYDVLLGVPLRQGTYRWAAPGHASYWTLDALRQFCDFALQQYSTDVGLARLQRKWDWHLRTDTSGGICDMTLLYLFQREFPELVGSLLATTGHDGLLHIHAFDLNVNYTENYASDEYRLCEAPYAPYGTLKEITWLNEQPYGYNLSLGQPVRFDGLHFQAGAKCLIENHMRVK